MFEEYLNDSHEFYLLASEAQINGDIKKARRYYRVSVMCALSALESFVNYTAKSFDEANNLDKLEICFLTDKEQYFSPTQGVKTRVKFNPLNEKLKVLIRRFNPKLYHPTFILVFSPFFKFYRSFSRLIFRSFVPSIPPRAKIFKKIGTDWHWMQ